MIDPFSCDEWLPKLRKEFEALWDCAVVGQSLRIQTPFPTVTSKLVSIFLHRKGEEFVVTDGGWLSDSDNPYEFQPFEDEQQEAAVVEFSVARHGVKQTFNRVGNRIFYKKTDDPRLVSARVFDVAAFVAAYVTSMQMSIPLTPPARTTRPLFRNRANEFLISEQPDIKINQSLPGIVRFRYHAVRYVQAQPRTVVTYVTGSNRVNFSNEVSSALLRARLLQNASYYREIRTAVTLYDDECGGFHNGEFDQAFGVLAEASTHPPFRWKDRGKLVAIL